MVVIAAVMIGLLLAMFLVNEHLSSSWEQERESLQAGAAADRVALAINRASAGGNGTVISFANMVGPDVTNMSIYDGRSVRAYYLAGMYVSSPLITNRTNATGGIPLNQEVVARNVNGTIFIGAG